MPWLTNETVVTEVEKKVAELHRRIDGRRNSADSSLSQHPAAKISDPSSPSQQLLAKIVGESLTAGQAIQKEWFCDSLGVMWEAGDPETWYVCRAPVAAVFTSHEVVHWTHWIGRVSTLIRDYIDEHGTFPSHLEYGPPGRATRRPLGPWVRYQFENGRLQEYEFRDVAGTSSPALAKTPLEELPVGNVDAIPAFGLKDIVELRDLAQDDQIRGPMAGTYILTGGPGVGKTTVALHRIPYLLLEQVTQLPAEVPDAPPDFFHEETMHVVVWKEHLVPYLKQCLQNLRFDRVPVYNIEYWVSQTLRDYVPIGRGKGDFRIHAEGDDLRRIKAGGTDGPAGRWPGLNEELLAAYLTGRGPDGHFHNPRAGEVAADLADLVTDLRGRFVDQPLPLRLETPAVAGAGTVAGIEAAIEEIRGALERLSEEAANAIRHIKNPGRAGRGTRAGDERPYERMLPVIRKARETVSAARDRAIGRLTADYPALLADFFGSEVVSEAITARLGPDAAGWFSRDAVKRLRDRRLSPFDRYLLLWTVHIVTRGAVSLERVSPLPTYSHTVIDEAQYYHPLVLRLLVDLSRPPLRSVTIVGDLEQKVSSDGGLVAWEDAGIRIERSNLFRLNTNYRWSKAVYRFLDVYRRLTGLQELKEPRRWASGAGVAPELVACADDEEEVDWLVERITRIRRKDWSVAVVAPPGFGDGWWNGVVRELASCDIRSRWATGEDVRECDEKIIITDYDSIVGLEFDAVFLPGCQEVLVPSHPGRGAIQAAWVALTRARKFIAVSHTDQLGVFDDPAFDSYRSNR